MIRRMLAVVGLCIAASSAQAIDFSTADALFQKREEGKDKVLEARNAYASLVGQTSGADKLYAIGQMARLDYVLGEVLLPKSEKSKRKQIFSGCLDYVEGISPANYGEKTEDYYTWKLMCFAFWADSASVLERVGRVSELKGLISEALPLTTNDDGVYVGTLEGGAIGRYVGAIYGDPQAEPVGLYKPDVARKLIYEARNAASRSDRAFPEPLSGEDYFENTYTIASTLIKAGDNDTAIIELEDGIELIEDMIADGTLPKGREFEAKFILNDRLKPMLDDLND